jgi:acyl-CoA thioesterase-1
MKETLVFLGDSNVDAGRLWDEREDSLGNGFVAEIAKAFSPEQFRLVNRGHYGFTVRDVWRDLHRSSRGVLSGAGCVTVLAGVNNIPMYLSEDQRKLPEVFREEYTLLLERIREECPEGRMILAEPFVFSRPAELLSWRPLLFRESEVIQELAGKYGADFLPLQSSMDLAERRSGAEAVTPDGLHLTAAGGRLLAEKWLSLFWAGREPSEKRRDF